MNKRSIMLAFTVLLAAITASAQAVTNVTAEQVNKTIYVSYDLNQQADISLCLSTDGGLTYAELHHVSGDVGVNVSAGHKTIVWDVLAEREKLVGDNIVFKVKAQGEDNLSFTVNGITFKMIYVKGGTFSMGCTSEQGEDCDNNEKPIHSVTLSDFLIGETEVTQALWQAVMGNNISHSKGANRPVKNVSWNDCQDFIQKLNLLTGKTFRLPTEAEWEYAARGGNMSRGYKYAGSNVPGEVSWCKDNFSWGTHPVKGKRANELGLYDMSGNVWEWCSDWFRAYGSSSQTNPSGPSSGSARVLRGGSWCTYARCSRVSDRNYYHPDGRVSSYGFRLALVYQ